MEDLQFECGREFVIDDTDEGTADLDYLHLYGGGRAEVQKVLEADGRIDSALDGAMSDRILDHSREALNTLGLFQHLDGSDALLV